MTGNNLSVEWEDHVVGQLQQLIRTVGIGAGAAHKWRIFLVAFAPLRRWTLADEDDDWCKAIKRRPPALHYTFSLLNDHSTSR